jgi:hypothetical protein
MIDKQSVITFIKEMEKTNKEEKRDCNEEYLRKKKKRIRRKE